MAGTMLVGAGIGALVGVIVLRINGMAPAVSIAMCAAIGGIVVFAYL
jgi:hypothetical protein